VRDLRKDLEICEKATKKFKLEDGSEPRYFGFTMIVLTDTYDNWKEDVKFVEESREGWPESINRAIAAEAEVEKLRKHRTEDIELMEEALEVHKLSLATITKLRKALALAHSMILGGEQHTEQSRQVIEGALGLL